jgi:hypothetical protein
VRQADPRVARGAFYDRAAWLEPVAGMTSHHRITTFIPRNKKKKKKKKGQMV